MLATRCAGRPGQLRIGTSADARFRVFPAMRRMRALPSGVFVKPDVAEAIVAGAAIQHSQNANGSGEMIAGAGVANTSPTQFRRAR